MRRLVETLACPPASVFWEAALWALDVGLNLPDQADPQDVQWAVGRWQLGLNLTAFCLAKTPKLRGYFRDRDDLIRGWLEWRAFDSRGVDLPERELYLWTQRGPRPGGKRPYARFFEGGLAEFEEQVRQARCKMGPNATHTAIWTYLGMPEATYYRNLNELGQQQGRIRRE